MILMIVMTKTLFDSKSNNNSPEKKKIPTDGDLNEPLSRVAVHHKLFLVVVVVVVVVLSCRLIPKTPVHQRAPYLLFLFRCLILS